MGFLVIVLFSPPGMPAQWAIYFANVFSLLGKPANRAIYFTFRNLARSANLPEGLSILLALISFFFLN